MAITFTNAKDLYTNNNLVIWDNQNQASLSFFFRYEPTGSTSSSVLNTNYFLTRGLGSFYFSTQSNGTANSLKVTFTVKNSTNSAGKPYTFNVGTTYHLAITYDQGQQLLWVNGIPVALGNLTGGTQSGNWPVAFGVASVPGTPFVYTLHDFAVWNGYVLTATDVANLRDGIQVPPQIGTGASGRWRWTMAGTTGASVQAGDAGVANAYGDSAYDITHFVGTGTAIYAPRSASARPPRRFRMSPLPASVSVSRSMPLATVPP